MAHSYKAKDHSWQRQGALSAIELARRDSTRTGPSSNPEPIKEPSGYPLEPQSQGDQTWLSLLSALAAQPNLQQRSLATSTSSLPCSTSNSLQSFPFIPPGLDFSRTPLSPSNPPLFSDHLNPDQPRSQDDSYSIADIHKNYSHHSEQHHSSMTDSDLASELAHDHSLHQFLTQQFKTFDSLSTQSSIPSISIPSASSSNYAFPPPEPFVTTNSADRRISLPLASSSSFERGQNAASRSTTSLPDPRPTPSTRSSGRSESADRLTSTSPTMSPKSRSEAVRRVSSAKPRSKSMSAESTAGEADTFNPDDEDDKRRRNTEASARFRAKKKAKVQDLSVSVSTLEISVRDLELEAGELRRENGWLKEIVLLKRNGSQSSEGTAKANETA